MEKKIAKIGIIAVLTLALVLSSFGGLNFGDTFAKEFDVGATSQTTVREEGASQLGADTSSNKITAQAVTTPPVWDGKIATGFAKGDGLTPETAFEISNGAELAYFSQEVNREKNEFNAYFYKLTADIVLNNTSNLADWENSAPANTWTPIGITNLNSSVYTQFFGRFDGQNHTVSGIYINSPDANNQGLFGCVGTSVNFNATVKNVGVKESYIKGKENVGGVVGVNAGKVINCYNTGTVIGTAVGGVVGYNSIGTVTDCRNEGAVSGTKYVGGVVGQFIGSSDKINYNVGQMNNCSNTGKVTGTDNVGGVVGGNGYLDSTGNYKGGAITDCSNSGTVTGTNNVGGVVGGNGDKDIKGADNRNGGVITNCKNTGKVTGTTDNIGGVVGYSGGGTVNNCNNTGASVETTGSGSNAGGVVGYNNGSVINCYNTVAVTANNTSNVGGVAGQSFLGEVTNCYNSGAVNGKSTVGGVAGINGTGYKITDCYNTGNVTGTADNVGGVVGENYGDMAKCNNSGTVNGVTNVGGIAGKNSGGSLGPNSTGTVNKCINNGAVSGTTNVGGVVGEVIGTAKVGIVINCYNNWAVSGTTNVGGVAGKNETTGSVINCYNKVAVTGTGTSDNVGGVVGSNAGSVYYCYNIGEVSSTGANVGGVAGANIGTFVSYCHFLKIPGGTNKDLKAVGKTADTTFCGTFVDNGGTLTAEVNGSNLMGNTLLDALNAGAISYNLPNNPPPPVLAESWGAGENTYLYPVHKAAPIKPSTGLNGQGTEKSPYQISTAADLAYMAQEVNSGTSSGIYYKLMADIVLNEGKIDKESNDSKPWISIGTSTSPFEGTFDGDGHTVSGVYIVSSEKNAPQGLFGVIAPEVGATIKNVGVINSYIMGHKNVGGIVGNNGGSITNCFSQSDVGVKNGDAESSDFGGVAGYNTGAIANCYSSGKVTGNGNVGGIIGNNVGGQALNSYFLTGTISIGGVPQSSTEEKAVGAGAGAVTDCAKFSADGATTATVADKNYTTLLDALNAGTSVYVGNPLNKTWYGVTGSYPSFKLSLYVDANKVIYANGLQITIKAGAPGKTNIYYNKDLYNPIKIGDFEPTAAGYDLSAYTVYGGGTSPVEYTSVKMMGGNVKSIYGGGSGVNGTVTGEKRVSISGDSIIGADNTSGIIINGGSVTNGVVDFSINENLTDGAKINIVLPTGYVPGKVATKSSNLNDTDVAKFTLVGAGAKNKKLIRNYNTWLMVESSLPEVIIDETAQTFEYNKTGKKFVVKSNEGLTEGFTVQYRKNGSGEYADTLPMDVGSYDVKVTRAGTDSHAELNKEIAPGLEITQKGVTLKWTAPASLVYDKTAKIPSVEVEPTDLVGVDTCVVTAGLTSGDNVNVSATAIPFKFTATALDNPNYKIIANAESGEYKITAKPLTKIKVSKVANANANFSNIALTADNCAGLVDTDVVTISFVTSSADKGTYTGETGFTGDITLGGAQAKNYSVAKTDVTATITGAPIPAITLSSTNNTYNANAQKPTVTIDGLTLDADYTLSWSYALPGGTEFTAVTGEPEFKNAGTYRVTATGAPGNYEGSTQTADYVITPIEVTLTWPATPTFEYTGSPIVPTVVVGGVIEGEKCEVTAAVTAGMDGTNVSATAAPFTFTAALSNPNYIPTNPVSGEYTITKATNEWTTPLSIANIYVGGTLAPNAVPTIGEVVYTYYTDNKDAKGEALEVAPTEVGTYWVTAKVAGTSNYVEIAESEAVKFTISQKPSVSEGGSITPKDILWTGIVNDLKFKDDPIVEKSVDSDIIPKKVLLELQKVDKTLKLSANGETLVITSKQVKPLTFDKAMYSFAELKAMLEVKPEITPTPTPTPTEKPTEPTEPTAKKCWLCGACPMFLGICLWIWLAVAIVAVAAVVVFIVLKKKKKNDKK